MRKLKHTVELIRADNQLSLTGENFAAYTEELLIVLYLANASIKSQNLRVSYGIHGYPYETKKTINIMEAEVQNSLQG